MKLEKRKRPRVFEEWVLLTSPKSSVVVCLRAQQQQQQQQRKEKKKKQTNKSVWCLSSQSVFIVLILIFVPLCSNRSRVHPHLISVSLFKKKKEKKKKGGEGREKEEESSAVFTVWYVGGILLPRPAPASSPLMSGWKSRERGKRIRRWGFLLSERRWLALLVSCVQQLGVKKTHLLHPSSSEH